MAQILQIHPGSNGYTRVVTLKPSIREICRPIHKLTPITHITSDGPVDSTSERGPVC